MYALLKLLHILAAVAFVGNVAVATFWYHFAVRTGDAKIVAHTIEGLNRGDRLFTFYGGIVLFLTGAALTWIGGFPLGKALWIWAGFALFLGSGAAFHALGAPLRKQLLEMAQTGNLDPVACDKITSRYQKVLLAIVLMLLAAMSVMVFKVPAL